jgi:sugar diacid utilization regulator
MINQLKKIFPSLVVGTTEMIQSSSFCWYIMDNGEKIGIQKDELTSKDKKLLQTFLTPYKIQLPLPSEQERNWQRIINQTATNIDIITKTPYRFVYFTMNDEQIEPTVFKESIQAMFDYPIPMLWENEREGMIIEEQPTIVEESLPYHQMIDVIMSDLYVNVHFFVGPYLNNYHDAKDQYNRMLTYAKIALSYSNKPVINYQDAMPFVLLEQTDNSFRHHLIQVTLKEFTTKQDFLKTIHTFLTCNLNISETAKKLFMHRNSLQYRIDKFIEKTGIDIRQFHQAVTVYFALLANMHKE